MQQRIRTKASNAAYLSSILFRPASKRLMVTPLADALGATVREKNNNLVRFDGFLSCYEQLAKSINAGGDVVRALAYNIGTNYYLYNPGSKVSDKAANALVNQLASAMDNEAFRRASDSDKQKLYELSVILGSYSLSLSGEAVSSGYTGRTEEARMLAGEGLRYLLKADPMKIMITDSGLAIAA
ncbi:MAG: hypothetical protein QM758_18450 [Armatimonas sp.]